MFLFPSRLLLKRLLCATALGSAACLCAAQPARSLTELKTITEHIENGVANNAVVVEQIAQRLDALTGTNDASSNSEKAQLIWLSAYVKEIPDSIAFKRAMAERRAALSAYTNFEFTS